MRIILFFLVFTSFPILNHFIRSGFLKLVMGLDYEQKVKPMWWNVTTIGLILLPLSVTVFYPQIADILSFVGSVAGFWVVFFFPTVSYLVKLK